MPDRAVDGPAGDRRAAGTAAAAIMLWHAYLCRAGPAGDVIRG
jgi:hypothetical protein